MALLNLYCSRNSLQNEYLFRVLAEPLDTFRLFRSSTRYKSQKRGCTDDACMIAGVLSNASLQNEQQKARSERQGPGEKHHKSR